MFSFSFLRRTSRTLKKTGNWKIEFGSVFGNKLFFIMLSDGFFTLPKNKTE